MGDGATTRTMGLLERSAELDALDGHLAAVREQGRGRLVLIAGEAGIGKTALVRAFCERAGRRPGPVGRVRRAVHPAPARAVRGHRRRAGRRARRRGGRGRGRGRARSRPWRDRCAAGRPTSSCSRTSTGPTRRRSTSCACSPAASSRSRRSCWPPTATTSSIRATRCGSSSASCPAAQPRGWRWRRCRRRAWPSSPARSGSITRSCIGGPRATRSTSPRCSPRPTPRSPRPSATPCSPAPRGWTSRARALLDAVAIAPMRAELWLLSALADGELDGLDGCLASGVLRAERDAVSFRHEIARVAVEEALAPHRRLALHRGALAALAERRAPGPRPPRPPRRGGRRRRRGAALRPGRRGARGHARVPSRGGRAVRPGAAPRWRPAV